MNEQIRVFVVDDHALFREGLLRLLDSDDALTIVGSADSAEAALEALPGTDTDILILDYDLGTHTAQHVVRGLHARGPAQRIPVEQCAANMGGAAVDIVLVAEIELVIT